MLQLICSNEVNYYALDEFWGWYLTQEIFQIFDVGFLIFNLLHVSFPANFLDFFQFSAGKQ